MIVHEPLRVVYRMNLASAQLAVCVNVALRVPYAQQDRAYSECLRAVGQFGVVAELVAL